MAFSSSSPSIKTSSFSILVISITIISSFLFYLLNTPTRSSPTTPRRSLLNNSSSPVPPTPCSSILQITPPQRCTFSLTHCHDDSNGLFNYFSLHFCLLHETPFLSLPSLALLLLLQFYFLVRTAQDHFSLVVTKLATHLNLSPSMGAVTLLALGNGAPDVFASVAAVRGGHPRTGLGAILSAGTFVSAFVVGFVAIYAAPFAVDPAPFVRDVFFYLTAAFSLFYVYLSAEIYLWQAILFVGFYAFFVGFVFWMDIRVEGRRKKNEIDMIGNGKDLEESNYKHGQGIEIKEVEEQLAGIYGVLGKISRVWKVPVSVILQLTIPQTSPSDWSRFYLSANIALCPLALLYSFNSVIPMDHKIVFLIPNSHFPLWSVVLFASISLALVHYTIEDEPPETEQMPVVLIAFVMSVFWISTVAGELLNCLAVIGTILDLPPALLGLTVLAWGNSIGDLVADVAVAKAGQPAMAMAGCFAGPMFNMLVGLGTGMLLETVDLYPEAYKLQFHISIVVAFVFLLLSLMGSLLVVTWNRFRVPRFWGFCLVGLYILFTVVSLLIAKFSR